MNFREKIETVITVLIGRAEPEKLLTLPRYK